MKWVPHFADALHKLEEGYMRKALALWLTLRKSSGDLPSDFSLNSVMVPTPFGVLAIFVALVLLFGSWFTIPREENGVIFRFGHYVRTVGPGLHAKLPWFEHLERVEVTPVQQETIGYAMVDDRATDKPEESLMLTADNGMVNVDWALQFQRTDAAGWLLHISEPETALRIFGRADMRSAVVGQTFDEVLTTGRGQLQTGVGDGLRAFITQYQLGATIVGIQVQDTDPPAEVRNAYLEVVRALSNQEQFVQEGNQHRNQVVPAAQAEAARIVADAEAYTSERVADARGRTNRFRAVFAEYKRAPQITRSRIQLETLAAILPNAEQVVDLTPGGDFLKLFQVNPVTAAR